MDITFEIDDGRFNYRVCAVIIQSNHLLAMQDERSPYFYLPSGRVNMHETAQEAILRELKEELRIDATILRPLWLNQSFFVEDVSGEKYHEICLYFLIDICSTDLLSRGKKFCEVEGSHTHLFEWLAFEKLENEYLYPEFIKKDIVNLTSTLTLRTEKEY